MNPVKLNQESSQQNNIPTRLNHLAAHLTQIAGSLSERVREMSKLA